MRDSMEFQALLNKMVVFVVLMVIGYYLARKGIAGKEFTRTASNLVLNVFMVGTILSSMLSTDRSMSFGNVMEILLLTSVTEVIGFVIGYFAVKLIPVEKNRKPAFEILISLGNTMFVGLPVSQVLFGSKAVFVLAISCIPFNILLFTYGVWRMKSGQGGGKISLSNIFSIPLIATITGLLLFFIGFQPPSVLSGLLSTLSGATMPMSMLVIGTSLGSVGLLDAFKDGRIAAASAFRLLIIPAATFFICRLLTSDPELVMICTIIAACPSAIIVSILSIQYGGDGIFSSQTVLHSTVCSIFTMLIIIRIFSSILGI